MQRDRRADSCCLFVRTFRVRNVAEVDFCNGNTNIPEICKIIKKRWPRAHFATFPFPDFFGNVRTEQKCLRFATSVKSAGCEPFRKVARSAKIIKYSWLETTFRFCNFFRKSWNSVTLTFPGGKLGILEISGSGVGKVHSTFLEDRCTPLKHKG